MGRSVTGTMGRESREHISSAHVPLPEPLTSSPIDGGSGREFNGTTLMQFTNGVAYVFIEFTYKDHCHILMHIKHTVHMLVRNMRFTVQMQAPENG